ncbi:MAG TPA: lipase family protein [Chitinophagaceae bacterium]|nr:lipase family protein [Chitinophagaceae bacterium]
MKTFLTGLALVLTLLSNAQSLKPGFDKEEMMEVMYVSARTGSDSTYFRDSNYIPAPAQYKRLYKSPVIGLENLYEIWTHDQNAIISVRGTVNKPQSWLANFYSAMVPAKGYIKISEADSFYYQVASNPLAAVHAGWMISTAFIARDLMPRMDSLYNAGFRNVIITGHSQGGGISYLLSAYLYNLQKLGQLPKDIRFKTYSTAAPKPGNLYFAYDYEANAQGGWAFNIVSMYDWVPEMPFSVQTTDDFNTVSPFRNIPQIIGQQNLKNRIVFNTLYKKLSKPPKQARDRYRKYLGDKISPQVSKSLKGFEKPGFYNTINYTRAATPIVLVPDAEYDKKYPDDGKNFWKHHMHQPYIYLLSKMQ